MSKILAVLCIPWLLSALQDDQAEMKWEVQKDDRFDLKWTYAENRTSKPGRGVATEFHDRRDVEAEIVVKEGEGNTQILAVALKKIVWSQSTHEYEVALSWGEGRKVDVKVQVKADPKSPTGPGVKQNADLIAEGMKKVMEGVHTIDISRKNETLLLRDGIPSRAATSIFDKIYLHSPLPSGGVRNGQKWKDPVDLLPIMATGLVDVKVLEYKVGPFTAEAATVKAGFSVPVNPPAAGAQQLKTSQTTSGEYSYSREYTFARSGYLQSSKEDSTFNKRVDAKGKDADFYKEDHNQSVKQALKITKKQSPKPADDKKEEKK